MFNKTKLALALSAGALGLGASALPVYAQDASDISNARHEASISTTYALNPYLQGDEINVRVEDGRVVLTGSVEDEVRKDLARQLALGVDGITAVDNDLVVDPDRESALAESDERSFPVLVEDASITAAIKSKLMWSRFKDAMDVDVDTLSGAVTLTGAVDNREVEAMAMSLAKDTRGVVSVDNQLTIKEASTVRASDGSTARAEERTLERADEANGSFTQTVSDTWITTKVKSTYAMSGNVKGRDISVTTTDGVVTLTGTVDSGEERELAIQLASNINGVNDVVSVGLLEYELAERLPE